MGVALYVSELPGGIDEIMQVSLASEVHMLAYQLDRLAQQLVEQAHQVCPYSNATRGNIDVALSINGVSLG